MLLAVTFGPSQLQTLKAASLTRPSALKQVKQPFSEIIQEVDKLYDNNKMKEALTYLERHSESVEAEVLWRLARLCYKVRP